MFTSTFKSSSISNLNLIYLCPCSAFHAVLCKIVMADDLKFLLWYLVPLLAAICSSNGQCTNGMCEKKSLSLKTDTKHNSSLNGYVFETFNFSIWKECFNMCLKKCQCLSFNFNEINETENCELNDATTKLAPEALTRKKGVKYYELIRTYFDKDVSIFVQRFL